MRTRWMVVLMLCSCGPQTSDPDGGWHGRTATVRPFKATLTASGLALQPDLETSVSWHQGGENWLPPVSVDVDGTQTFEVADGPVLYEVGPSRYVYSSADVIEPCMEAPPIANVDAGIEFELTLTQPAGRRDVLTISNSQTPTLPRTFVLDGGSTTFTERLVWRTPDPLNAGPTTIVQLSEALPYDGFDRQTAVGRFDAGILDPFAPGPVRGTLEPVASAGDFNIQWDGFSLGLLGSSTPKGGAFPPTFVALKGGVGIATLSTDALKMSRVPMVMPALEPDGQLVVGTFLAQLDPDGGITDYSSFYGWRSPWPDAPEMKATFRPATEVRMEGGLVTWVAPSITPQFYEVRLLDRVGGTYRPMAFIFTDETRIRLPLGDFASPRIEVIATYGTALSATKCTVFEHLDTWARLPAFGVPAR